MRGARWFWLLIAIGTALASIASTLTALAVENPTLAPEIPKSIPGVSGACLGLLNVFQQKGDPLDSSDVPLLVFAGAAVLGCVVAFWAAAQRR